MAISVLTNQSSQESLRYLDNNTRKNSNVIEQMASGKRINRAADDPSGAAISATMKKDMVSTRQAGRNALQASSILQMMDSTLGVVGERIIRLKQLSMQAATDTVSDKERQLVDIETQELLKEMNALVGSAKYNDIKLLDGTSPKIEFLVGAKNNSTGKLVLHLEDYDCSTKRLGLFGFKNITKDDAQSNLNKINAALLRLNGIRASLGAMQSGIEKIKTLLVNNADTIEGTKSQIVDADFAKKTADMVKGRIQADFNGKSLIKSNMKHALALKLIAKP